LQWLCLVCIEIIVFATDIGEEAILLVLMSMSWICWLSYKFLVTLEKSVDDKLDIILFYVLFRAVVHGTETEDRFSKAGY
jgi:hypothetical protein